MRWFWFRFGMALLAASAVQASQAQQGGASDFGQGYEVLEPRQKTLFDELIRGYSEIVGEEVAPEVAFRSLPLSVRTTYHAVTHALQKSTLTDAQGNALGTALDRVASIETIRGRVKGARGDLQFRIYCFLEPDTVELLEQSQEFERGHDNTIYHKGYPTSYRQQGGVPSIQFSISRDGTRADIDVDYRSSKFPAALINGHLTSANSDVRAGNNFGRHQRRWIGLSNWWRSLLDFDLSLSLQSPESDEGAIPDAPRKGKAELHEAVADFLNALLVEGAANEAVAYVSQQAYACWELKGLTNGEPLNRGLAPFIAKRQYEQIHQQLTTLLGEITDLRQVTRGVRVNYPGLRVVRQPFHDRFVLYEMPEGSALEWSCATRLAGEAPAKKDSTRYGKYYLAIFRVPPQSQGATVGLLLAKEGGHWKVITYDDEADVDYSAVPDLRPPKTDDGELTITTAEPSLIRATHEFHRNWFVARNFGASLSAFSPDVFDCGRRFLREGESPPENLEQMLDGWREGMRRASEEIGLHQELSDAIRSVTPATNDLALVRHPDQEAFTLLALPDGLGAASSCSSGPNRPNEEQADAAERAQALGNYYSASFQAAAAGGNPAVLTTFWRKRENGWGIYAYRIVEP